MQLLHVLLLRCRGRWGLHLSVCGDRTSLSLLKISFSNRSLFQRTHPRRSWPGRALEFEGQSCRNKCGYNNICRQTIVVYYQAENKLAGDVYIGSTHQNLITRMQQHTNTATQCHKTGQSISSFATYWATYFHNFKTLTPGLVRNNIDPLARQHLVHRQDLWHLQMQTL